MNPTSPAASGRTLALDALLVSSAFPGGAGADFERAGDAHARFTVPPDPDCHGQPGYDYLFSVRVSNGGSTTRRVVLEARMPGSGGRVSWSPSRIPVFASPDSREWFVIEAQAAPTHRELRVEIDVPPGATVYCSNSLPCPSDSMERWLQRLAGARPRCVSLSTIGRSGLGRPMIVATVTDTSVDEAGKDRVFITSGFHPAEPDWLATAALLEELASDAEWAAALRRQYVFDVVPHVNPDGFDLGTNASNSHGVNMYWDFRRADPDTSPEAVALWRWVEAHPPDVYVDYHAYVYQLSKNYRPYIRPSSDYPPEARAAVRAMDRAITALCGGRGVRGAATSDPLSLAPQLTSHFGTITYPKFHLHLYHGVEACRTLGVAVTRTLIEAAAPYRPLRSRTGRAPWTGGGADRLRGRLQQAQVIVKARNVLARAMRRVLGRAFRGDVVVPATPGLPPHWTPFLWRHRPLAQPVYVVGQPGRAIY